jgi:hypothetical protein
MEKEKEGALHVEEVEETSTEILAARGAKRTVLAGPK